jgi:hypothetical protein
MKYFIGKKSISQQNWKNQPRAIVIAGKRM